jgi:hypothetical protein
VTAALATMAVNTEKHLKERLALTSPREAHVGVIAQRMRMLAECGEVEEARAVLRFVAMKAEDPTLPVPEEGPASYLRAQALFRTRINAMVEHMKNVMTHARARDAEDYSALGFKIIRIVEATFMGVEETWSTLRHVPLSTALKAMEL